MNIKVDPELLSIEKETVIQFDRGTPGLFSICTCDETVIKYLLSNPAFMEEDRSTRIIEGQKYLSSIKGKLPLSCLRLRSKETESMNYISKIVS